MQFDWWTLALQTINVLVLVWILAHFFFRPIAVMVAKRQEEIGHLMAQAAAEREKAEQDKTAAAAERRQIAAQRQALLEEARGEAEAEKALVLALSAEALAHQREEAEAALARQRHETEGELIAQASSLSIDIAQRLLRRLSPETVFEAFLAGLEVALEHLPDDGATGLAASDGEHAVEVITAAPLGEAQAGQVRTLLEQAAGAPVTLVFRAEPDLIAGIEVHARNTIIRNNWQADLARIREELVYDHNHVRA